SGTLLGAKASSLGVPLCEEFLAQTLRPEISTTTCGTGPMVSNAGVDGGASSRTNSVEHSFVR
ncbi:unnamed protein product, partial [Amoebophrya sp. A25]